MAGQNELSAKQIKQLNSSKAGMIFRLEADSDFFQWKRWQRVIADWLAAVDADAYTLDARSTRVLATLTVDKDLLLSVVNLASATTYEGPHMSWA